MNAQGRHSRRSGSAHRKPKDPDHQPDDAPHVQTCLEPTATPNPPATAVDSDQHVDSEPSTNSSCLRGAIAPNSEEFFYNLVRTQNAVMTTSLFLGFDPTVMSWLNRHGLAPPETEHPDWGFKLSFSTVPVFDWTVRRSKIRPQELWFGIGLHRITGWTAVLFPRDESFRVTWRSSGAIDVQSQSLILRKRTAWPSFATLDDLPDTLVAIEAQLGKTFLRAASYYGQSLKSTDFAILSTWLRPVCDELNVTLGTVYGGLPVGEEVDDGRSKGEGVSLTLRLSRVEP